MISLKLGTAALLVVLTASCTKSADEPPSEVSSNDDPSTTAACDAEPTIRSTSNGIDFVRTPDSCFENLPDWNYEAKYIEIDGLRQAYIDEGSSEGPVVLLLHGQPSWSYLYRKMIPALADAGMRVIAMDHLGMGRSDKPTDIGSYSYVGHYDRLVAFIEALNLRDIHLFVQDWGSLIGLRVVGLHPEWFARVAIGNGALADIPISADSYPVVENPDEILDIPSIFDMVPEQQIPFSSGCEDPDAPTSNRFATWMEYAMKARNFRASEVLEAGTWFDLPDDEVAAYDAPFPSRTYMAGPRVFPSLVNEIQGANTEAMRGFLAFDQPVITIWGGNDPGGLGRCATQDTLITEVIGAEGQAHVRLMEAGHFLQDDQGPAIASRLIRFFTESPPIFKRGDRYCEISIYKMTDDGLRADVYGSQGMSDCPAEAFNALDAEALRVENDADYININGPRAWIPNTGWMKRFGEEDAFVQQKTFGGLTMQRIASFHFPDGPPSSSLYSPNTVIRSTTFVYKTGEEIYQLNDPEGRIYIMQSLNQANDSTPLADAGLAGLGGQLSLPEGWSYSSRVLESSFILRAEGTASALRDDFGNTYQLFSNETPDGGQSLPVAADGTGLTCESDEDCQNQTAAHCLVTNSLNFCTVEGCAPGGCDAPYVCCHSCNEAFASFLPFEGSACIPGPATEQLEGTPGCTCD